MKDGNPHFNKHRKKDSPTQITDRFTTYERGEMLAETTPFYQRLLRLIPIPNFVSAFLIMTPSFIIHYLIGLSFGVNTLADFSWFLPFMSGAILILLIWATGHLKSFALQLYPAFGIDVGDQKPLEIIRHHLSDKTMLKFGLLFGSLNVSLGSFYGVWYKEIILNISLIYQIFLVGFIAGLAISGIVSILKAIRYLKSSDVTDIHLNCPDNCGGMVRIGNSLLKFSLVSLIAGILIAYYIYNTPWSNQDWTVVRYFMYAWMGFPHVAAITVLFIPFYDIHLMLTEKKNKTMVRLYEQLEQIRQKLLSSSAQDVEPDVGRFDVLSTKHDILRSMYEEVENVNDWPTNPRARTSYAFIYISSLVLPIIEIYQIISGLNQ